MVLEVSQQKDLADIKQNAEIYQIFFNYVLSEVIFSTKIVGEYDQEIPQSQTADNPMALRGRATQPSQDARKTS